RIDLAQADIHAGRGRDRPWEAPTVAMKHRQGPEIDRMLAEIAREDVADRVQVSAAMMGDDALGIARGTGRVAQRNRVPFVLGHLRHEGGVALRERRLVFDLADAFSAGESRIIDVDDERLWSAHELDRL